MKTYTADDFKQWGAQGGKKSKRKLTSAQAKAMVAAREKKRRKKGCDWRAYAKCRAINSTMGDSPLSI